MQTNFKVLLIVIFLLLPGFAAAQVLESPTIEVTRDRTAVAIAWPPVANAQGYRLLYAPYPYTGAYSVQTIDLGNQTALSAQLWDGASYYVAVTAYDGSTSSSVSNIELFYLSAAPVLDPDAVPVTGMDWYKPPVSITWQWQLSGKIDTSLDVEMYDIDLFNTPESVIKELHDKLIGR